MNIWIVNQYAIPPSLGGLVRHYYFSKYMQQDGHKVRIFTSSKIHNSDINLINDNTLYKEKMVDGIEYTFVHSRDYKGNGIDRVLNMLELPFKMWKAMKAFKKEGPDVIYTSSPSLFIAFFSLLFGRRNKIPVVVEIRDLWPESIVEYNGMSRRNPIILMIYQLEKWIYKNATQLIFTFEGGSDYIKDKKWDRYIDLDKVNYVNNGVDLKEFAENIGKAQIDDPDLIDKSKFKVVYVGSIRRANSVKNLVDVARTLQTQNKDDILFLIYGDGVDKNELESECKRDNLVNIKFKGKVEKKYIPYILSNSNLNILNYKQSATWKYGGSQNKQFEYLASGIPVCSNVEMGYSIMRRYQCGIEENMETVQQYAEAILAYKDMDKEEYEQQCKNARKAAEEFDYPKLSLKIEKILEHAVGNI
ncbi:glycosyltransferase family 4 protein [[Clostridium] hylemonae]|uniref:Glycosyltransferase, group 1 family protein n=1 Tax=[Clostridium] hylemonae DSM 15053 TaxID=553973 RepID=C0C2C4_9FIRM|nr:glycosyltransferase family 4 protein [[Clostridium] hylemonae]EEG73548.1 glycosyltransferase, group 1 family protein [[Clostridium] hylemonae DSM 15053]QEK17149.1 hypothetical protein LAJLEIBI_01158 [[Clostridium] hylemonae DSM 15053]